MMYIKNGRIETFSKELETVTISQIGDMWTSKKYFT